MEHSKNAKSRIPFRRGLPKFSRRRSGAAQSGLDAPHDEPPNRRFRRAFYNWDGSEPTWRPNPTADLRELVTFAKLPFAAIAPRATPLHFQFWQQGKPHFVRATPVDPDIGLATVADLDVMIVVAAYLTWLHNHDGAPYDGALTLRPATILQTLGKSTGGAQHRNLDATLARLTNTEITTTLSAYGGHSIFRLLTAVHRPNNRDALKLYIDPWLWREVQAERIAKLDPVAFTLRGLERRLYSWARVHLGAVRKDWRISVPRAHAAIGSQDALRKFRSRLAQVSARQRLPHFLVHLERDGQNTDLVLTRRAPVTVNEPLSLSGFDDELRLGGDTAKDDSFNETVFVCATFADDD